MSISENHLDVQQIANQEAEYNFQEDFGEISMIKIQGSQLHSFVKSSSESESEELDQEDFNVSSRHEYNILQNYEQQQQKFEEEDAKSHEFLEDFPLECIGLLRSQWYNEQNHLILVCYGTGFLISDRILVTCGHSVFSETLKRKCNKVSFIPGVNGVIGNTKVYISVKQNFLHFFQSQLNQTSTVKPLENDIAMIFLQEPVKLKRYLKIQPNNSISGNLKVIVSGYSNKRFKSERCLEKVNAKRSLICGQTVEFKREDNSLYYNIPTKIGQAGSPVLVKCDNDYVVVGIHTHKSRGTVNSALLLTQRTLIQMLKLYKECFLSEIPREQLTKIEVKQSLNKGQELSSFLKQMKNECIINYSFIKFNKSNNKSYSASFMSIRNLIEHSSSKFSSSDSSVDKHQLSYSSEKKKKFNKNKHKKGKILSKQQSLFHESNSLKDELKEVHQKIKQTIKILEQYSSGITSLMQQHQKIQINNQYFNNLIKSMNTINYQASQFKKKIKSGKILNHQKKSFFENRLQQEEEKYIQDFKNIPEQNLDQWNFKLRNFNLQKQKSYLQIQRDDHSIQDIEKRIQNIKDQHSYKIGSLEQINHYNCQSQTIAFNFIDQVERESLQINSKINSQIIFINSTCYTIYDIKLFHQTQIINFNEHYFKEQIVKQLD